MLAPEYIKAISVKENSLLITKVIYVCHFWKITLSIKLKKFCLLPSSFSNKGGSIMGLENSFIFIISAIFCSSISMELSSLISCFTIFAFVVKSCSVTGFISTLFVYFCLFFLIFSFLSFFTFCSMVFIFSTLNISSNKYFYRIFQF